MRIDAAILAAVVAFLFPLRLLSLLARLSLTGSAGDLRRPCAAFALSAVLLAAIFALPRDHARECAAASVVVPDDGEGAFRGEVRSDIEQLKLQLVRLESMWDNNSKPLDGKTDALEEEDGEVVRAMGMDIQSLINEHENIKESLCGSYSDNTIKAMEKEVQILIDESRKMESSIYKMWSFAKQTEKRVEDLYSDVKKKCLRGACQTSKVKCNDEHTMSPRRNV
uniref:Uncharacterized protein n=1 Tax=Oryza meridionalis TaxID=40149 RepID=A0A0E0DYK0_9ORYZ